MMYFFSIDWCPNPSYGVGFEKRSHSEQIIFESQTVIVNFEAAKWTMDILGPRGHLKFTEHTGITNSNKLYCEVILSLVNHFS